uniref:Uncharacterized protein n=1 Tax=Catagonus wagneri TaxID=51154 RepID=A0A8C3X3T9_9CETA
RKVLFISELAPVILSSKHSRGSPSSERGPRCLQAPGALKVVEKALDAGRTLTRQGRRDLDGILGQVVAADEERSNR